MMDFEKFHGNGNDFIFISAAHITHFTNIFELTKFTIEMCQRHTSVGADGIIFVNQVMQTPLRIEVLILNSDGSVAATCGNALRCLGLKLMRDGYWDGKSPLGVYNLPLALDPTDTRSSDKPFATLIQGSVTATPKASGSNGEIEVGMGTEHVVKKLSLPKNNIFHSEHAPVFVQLQNPHLVFVSSQFANFTQENHIQFGLWAQNTLSTEMTDLPICNISMLQPKQTSATEWILNVFERGAGFTMCCGSGATASRVALENLGLIDSKENSVCFRMPGGPVTISSGVIAGEQQCTLLGPAEWVFSGYYPV